MIIAIDFILVIILPNYLCRYSSVAYSVIFEIDFEIIFLILRI
jgi:hypothetical protein